MINKEHCASGRRKAAAVHARIKEVASKDAVGIVINNTNANEYFLNKNEMFSLMTPIRKSGIDLSKYNIRLFAKGGGKSAQSDAANLAISRALSSINEDFAEVMREFDLLRADTRKKERKKYGMKGPRAKGSTSKR